jgi:hypothetical protein
MQHEYRIIGRHIKIRHVATVTHQCMHPVVDALEVVVVVTTILQGGIGKDCIIGLGTQELVGTRTEPARITSLSILQSRACLGLRTKQR